MSFFKRLFGKETPEEKAAREEKEAKEKAEKAEKVSTDEAEARWSERRGGGDIVRCHAPHTRVSTFPCSLLVLTALCV